MPEGHTIHRLALDHMRDLAGGVVDVSSPQGRHPELSAELDGLVLERVDALGKHLFYHWRGGPILHIHLGLIGHFETRPSPPPAPKSSTQLRLSGPRATVDLFAATTTELIDAERLAHISARLGPDVLSPAAEPERAWQRLTRKAVPIGQALLDQQILSGVGNVYRAEALFVNGIHPLRLANTLTRTEFDGLWVTLTTMLRQGVEDRRIITVHPSERNGAANASAAAVAPQDAFYIYRREHCRRCGTAVRSWALGPRRVYACERCQPPPEAAIPRQRP